MARQRLRAELGLSQQTPLVGLIGRFDPQKNHIGFFVAAGMLHRRLSAVHFVLAGRDVDTENETLRQAIQQAGVSANTHLLGLRSDMSEVMAALDVLASSSSYGEAFFPMSWARRWPAACRVWSQMWATRHLLSATQGGLLHLAIWRGWLPHSKKF